MIDFPNLACDLVKEVPIVRDHYECARGSSQESFQPAEPAEVEVVSGFVEDEQVRLCQESLCERCAGALSAADRFERRRQGIRR